MLDTSEKCPECGEPVLAAQHHPAWCPACEWGVISPNEQRASFFRSRLDRWSARQAESLFQQVSGSAVNRPGWSLARVASYALAVCVHAVMLALIGIGIWLILGISSVPSIVLGLFALLLAFEVRPRLGNLRKLKHVRRREDAPVLFALLDQVAAEAGAKPVHAVLADGNWNASYLAIGWRGRRVVTLGLPLWDALPADQKVALLGHEFAHGVNGDARHGGIVGTSVATLARLYAMFQPGRKFHRTSRGSVGLHRVWQSPARSWSSSSSCCARASAPST
jgi:Zn-dependent protease with chaperone function